MKALVIGGGGREHAIAWKLSQSPATSAIYSAPGNFGTNLVGSNLNIPVTEPEALADWAKASSIDLTVVGPETALAYGVVDVFRERGLRAFGPTRAAAQLETSKSWAKAFMQRHDIPTAPFREFDHADEAAAFLESLSGTGYPVVVKADGLSAGKGVTVAMDRHSAIDAVRKALQPRRNETPPRVLVEGFLTGYEVSFMAISDGVTVWPLAPSRDYKRAFDGNTGPMTGGMGAYSPVSTVDDALTEEIMRRIIRPAVEGMAAEGLPYQGVLYAGLMITRSGPQVLEFNARFGDPETQVVLPRLESDLYVVIDAALDGQLNEIKPLRWSRDAACGVVIASSGYPGEVETGYGVVGLRDVGAGAIAFHSGTRNPFVKPDAEVVPKRQPLPRGAFGGRSFASLLLPSRTIGRSADKQAVELSRDRNSQVITAGGRVLTVVGRGRTLDEARSKAYVAAEQVTFTGSWFRGDIAADDASLST